MDGELPRRDDLGLVFDELDYQLACQAYLWALPLVSFAQWQTQHYEVFGGTDFDLVHYVSYRDRLGIISIYVHQATGMNMFFGFRTLDPERKQSQALVDAVRIIA